MALALDEHLLTVRVDKGQHSLRLLVLQVGEASAANLADVFRGHGAPKLSLRGRRAPCRTPPDTER